MLRRERDTWVAALRSGKYKQIQEQLGSPEGYCALGLFLACVRGWDDPEFVWRFTEGGDWIAKIPLTQFQRHELVEMNDYEGMSFKEIADWIERNIPVTE